MQNRKNKNHYRIPRIRTSQEMKLSLKQTILNFYKNFAQIGHFWFKTEKVNVIIYSVHCN